MSWHSYNNILHETICINLLHIFSLTEKCFSVSVATNKRNACQSKPTANLHELWLCVMQCQWVVDNHSPFSRCIGDPTKFVLVARLNTYNTPFKSYSHVCQPNCQIKTIIAFREQDIRNFFHRNFLFNLSRSAGMKFVHM